MNKPAMKRTLHKSLLALWGFVKVMGAALLGSAIGMGLVLAIIEYPLITFAALTAGAIIGCFVDTYLNECKQDENENSIQ